MQFAQTIKKEIFSIRSLLAVIIIAFAYVFFADFFLNAKNIFSFFSADFAPRYKFGFLFFTLTGFWQILSPLDQVLLIVNALLTGLNFLLIAKTIAIMKHKGKIRLSVGGATIITLITSGCASCGISVISFLGIASIFSFLPFKGLELHILATILLVVSFFYMLWELHKSYYCKISMKK